MPLAPIVNTALGGSAAGPTRVLFLDGNSVLRQAGNPGNLYGVPQDSIEVVERGPGGISSMTFRLNDPLKAITLREGMQVRYEDLANNRPDFRGDVLTWSVVPFGLGRVYTVKCRGREVALDWMIVPPMTFPAGTFLQDAIQAAAGAALGVGIPLRAFSSTGFGDDVSGSQASPVARFTVSLSTVVLAEAVTITNPTTLREVLNLLGGSALSYFVEGPFGTTVVPRFTIDFYDGLRAYSDGTGPSDYAGLTVADTVAAANAPENLNQQIDTGQRVRNVYVIGGNAAGSGLVPDGSGIPGATAVINDSSILTDSAKRAAANAYMRDKVPTGRGSLELNGNTVATNVRPGSILTLTDAETGSTGTYPIGEIRKKYRGPRQDWTISFGGMPASLSRSVRRLTRGVLS